ncbi:MAG TPA: MFS transporter [Usitatibacter sp.]|nr:MFS transporter [Usitatibacter sp.]
MNRIARKYVEFVRQPDVARLLVVALLSRMPIGMVGFSMLMFLRESLGNFALAGTAVGINFISLAIAAPIQGRLIDRHGPRPLLFVTGAVQPLALGAILYTATEGYPFAVVAACAALAGIFASPITTVTRTMWRHRFENEDDRRTAFALDAVTIELNFTLGPAIIAAVLAAYSARAAFGLAIASVVAALAIYLGSGTLRLFKRVAGEGPRHLLGPLTEPRLLLIFAATFGLTICFGLLEVGYPAFGTALAIPAVGGILLAVNSLGSAAGGMLYGGMHFRASVERQFTTAMGLMALPLFLHALWLEPVVFGIVAFFAGALIAPSITAQSVLVSRLAPARYATEAFTWSSTFIVSGIGAGVALGGHLVETAGLRAAFATGGFIMAAMSLLMLAAFPTPALDSTTND